MLLIELGISKLSVNDLQSWKACALILVNFASFANFTHFKLSQLKNADSLISIRSLGIVIVPMILIQSLKALAPKKVKFSDKVTWSSKLIQPLNVYLPIEVIVFGKINLPLMLMLLLKALSPIEVIVYSLFS